MKKAIALVLALIMCMGVAQAAQWEEGTSPSQPYPGVPEIKLDEQMGYMMFYPTDKAQMGVKMGIETACQRLYIYLPREDVKAGDATFYLCSEAVKRGEIWKTAMSNTEAVTQRPITEEELDGLLWGGGTCFEIKLPETLELGTTYFVNMERGCIVSDDGVDSPEVGGTDAWTFTLEGDWGVNKMTYRRALDNGKYEEGLLSPKGGDEIRFDLVLGGDAVAAVVNRFADESVEFDSSYFTESGEVTGMVMKENPQWLVVFLDDSGNELNRVEFW